MEGIDIINKAELSFAVLKDLYNKEKNSQSLKYALFFI